MLGSYINKSGCQVPIKKLGDGYYMFGTRKIYAKILNGKLVIRVGGGYMIIEEFISSYAEKELMKIESQNNVSRTSEKPKEVSRRKSQQRINTSQEDLSYQAQPSSLLSGTTHTKRITETMLNKMRSNPSIGREMN